MTEQLPTPPADAQRPTAGRPRSETRDTLSFLLKLLVAAIVLRSFVFSPFNIPSQSMLPQLYVGDYLFVSKWNYGYSRYSLPFGLPLIPGRVLGRLPARGDVVVFKAPPKNSEDYIKRVIGLPGDTIRMVHGQVILNGVPVKQQRVADFEIPITPNYSADPDPVTHEVACPAEFVATGAAGGLVCRYHAFRETLPGGKTYLTIDRGDTRADDTDTYVVPAGHVFMMGDNRDDSEDSRFAQDAGGIGYVPIENLEGRAAVKFWSTDGSASIFLPWTWFGATRWSRIGSGF